MTDKPDWFEQTVRMVHEQGYRVIPIGRDGVPRKYADGQTYISMADYQDAKAIGVVLDEAVLLDYDGNKADEKGEQIMDLETLAATLGLEEMPECVQEGSKGRSLHWLFSRGDRHTSKSSCDGWLDHIDVKTRNQLLHLKPGKIITDDELPHKSQLPQCPDVLLESLQGRRTNGSGDVGAADLEQAQIDLMQGANVHASALTITNHLIFEGKSADEIRGHFINYGEAIATRGSERSDRFWKEGELDDIIQSGMEKYEGRVVTNVEDDFPVVIGGGQPGGKKVAFPVDWTDYVFLGGPGVWRRLSTGEEWKPANFNTAHQQADTRVLQPNGSWKRLRPSDFLQDVVKVPQIYAAIYAPGEPAIFKYNFTDVVNTYMPNRVPEVNPDWQFDHACRVIEDHFLTMFDDEQFGRLVIQWMAHNVQQPGEKILWAPIICGVNGDGKSTIRNILGAVMGQDNVKDVSTNEIHSQFNAYAEGACVAALEEIRVRGHNRHEVMNALKPLITNPIVSVVKKGRDAMNVPNVTNYVAFTNYPDALALDQDDRRWVVLYTKFNSTAEMKLERNLEYWEAVHHAYRQRAGSLRGWLLDYDLEGFDPNFPPNTGWHKERMVAESKSESEKILVECLDHVGEIFTWDDINTVGKSLGARDWNASRIGSMLKSLGYMRTTLKKYKGKGHRFWCTAAEYEACMADEVRYQAKLYEWHQRGESDKVADFSRGDGPENW